MDNRLPFMTPRRRRRSPEESRGELLAAAAARLIRERGPDNVSLRQIAEAAGVAHGLVTHYFGTYAALVREVLTAENDRVEERVRERIRAERGVPTAAGIMGVLFDILADERYLRLFVWAEMHSDYQGAARPELVELMDAIEAGIRAALAGRPVPSRSRIEAVARSICATPASPTTRSGSVSSPSGATRRSPFPTTSKSRSRASACSADSTEAPSAESGGRRGSSSAALPCSAVSARRPRGHGRRPDQESGAGWGQLGQFVFPMDALCQCGVVSANGSGGKRAFRVYPPWVTTTNRQASTAQAWQLDHFLHLPQDRPIDSARAQELYYP
ncbi:MepB family protein [Streptosporangium sp. NPDC000396]|uniref:MepB family protein n=1 Tax=Streptosporangium sp. NPDC000396 TaxID=3366185 RepID=UPI003678AED8